MDIEKIISRMTLEQKADFCSGKDTWHTVDFEEYGIPQLMLSDGPHGLRKQEGKADELGVQASIEAVCFPAACATACSYNTELLHKMGVTLAKECKAVGVDILLGPGINIKRSPLGGRDFEYFSEDPVVSAEMACAFIDGCQSEGVGTSLKHFALNSQETHRLTCSSVADERTMHELYLYAFEQVVKRSQPWTVMSAYNRVNGIYASENKWLLTDLLRDKWGYEGFVVSDWGAVSNRATAVEAGCDLEMPYCGAYSAKLVVDAVRNGTLDEATLDESVRRILRIMDKCLKGREDIPFDKEGDHKIAKEIADECVVLLKNDGILPLKTEQSVAVIGEFARDPRHQGGGSSNVNSFKVSGAIDHMSNATFARGYSDDPYEVDQALIDEAVNLAKTKDVAVVFAGLPIVFEAEGADRQNMALPASHNALIEQVAAVNPNTVVVLHNGSPVEMPWIDQVLGLVEAYLGGQAVGESVADILYGRVNPSGKLAETFPIRLEDNPAYINFGGSQGQTYYHEGVFVGYRYYDKKKMDVLFPFGYGLSYTEFEYSDLKLSADKVTDQEILTVTAKVTNVGKVAGKESVQLYVRDLTGATIRPIRELKSFAKVELAPGETKEVTFKLDNLAFSWYSDKLHDFYAESGEYVIELGKNSRDIVLETKVVLEATKKLPLNIDQDTPLGVIWNDPRTADLGEKYFVEYCMSRFGSTDVPPNRYQSAINAPLRYMRRVCGWGDEYLQEKIAELNSRG